MLAIFYFLLFCYCGTLIMFCLFPKKGVIPKVWLGLSLGLVLMMWLPALFAFVMGFTTAAHLASMGILIAASACAYFFRDKTAWKSWDEQDTRLGRALLFTALPLTIVGGYLQWTHILNPVFNSVGEVTWHVGQSTYGDLPLHLAIASSLRNASFPADYNILPGALLSYPFLTDSLSTSFMLLGFSLRAAMVFPGIVMMGLTFSGYAILADRMAESRKAAILATLLFFLNGGLGFMYLVDMKGMVLGSVENNELQSVKGLWERIVAVVNGWYQTPANHREFTTYNLRWSNVIVDMMVPQRTTLGGWTQLLPCLYLLYDAIWPEKPWGLEILPGEDGPTGVWNRRQTPWRQVILLGLWGGALPMINTHCFLALALLSLGFMAYDLIHTRHDRRRAVLFWALYGGIAAAVSLPQLFTWTFRQAVGNERFLNFHFNWVNNSGNGMLDGYLWFYIKNIGLPFILILLSLLEKNQKRRFIASGAFVVFAVAEFIQFQPNEYDNNKLFYVWYMLCCVLAADYGFELLGKLKGLRAKPVIAVMCLISFFFTGVLAVAREIKSDYQMFSHDEILSAQFVEESTPEHCTFMTGTQHINPVSSIAGRNIVCGPDLWLSFHGFNNDERKADIQAFYMDPAGHTDVLEKYGVNYILLSSSERNTYGASFSVMEGLFRKVYESPERQVMIFAVD